MIDVKQPNWDLEMEAWAGVRDALIGDCRACEEAGRVAFEGYEDILTGQRSLQDGIEFVEEQVALRCRRKPSSANFQQDSCKPISYPYVQQNFKADQHPSNK